MQKIYSKNQKLKKATAASAESAGGESGGEIVTAIEDLEVMFHEKAKAYENLTAARGESAGGARGGEIVPAETAARGESAGGARGGEIVPAELDDWEVKFRKETKAYEKSTGMTCVVEKIGSQLKRRCKST